MAASAVLVVLLLLTTVFSAGTIVTIRNAENQMTDVYKLGSFTHNVTVDRSEFGVNTVVSFFKNFKYYKVIISVQNIEAQIRYEEKRIQEYIALGLTSSTDYSDEIKGCRDNIAKCRVEIDGHMNTLTEEEKTLLTDELMKDEDFIYPLGAFYTIHSMGAEDTYGNSPEHIAPEPFMTASWLSFFLMIITLLMAVIIFVVFAVNTVTKIIYLATHIMKADATVVEKCCFKTDAAALMIMVLAGMFSATFGNSVAFGSGLIGVIVCVILSAVVTGISRVLLADKFSFGEIAKFAISVVSVILLTVMVFSFFNIGIFGTTSDYASDYAKKEYLYKVE